jgi:hypothetical protein
LSGGSANNGRASSSESALGGRVDVVTFGNGTRQETFPDGRVVIRFFNDDVKESFTNGEVRCTTIKKARFF